MRMPRIVLAVLIAASVAWCDAQACPATAVIAAHPATVCVGQRLELDGGGSLTSGHVYYEWDFDGGTPDSASWKFGYVKWTSSGEKTVKLTVSDDDDDSDTATTTVTVVEISDIQYKIGSDGYQSVPSTLVVAKGADVTFKVIKDPASAPWPSGAPSWGGSSGASGTGETKEVDFDTASANPTDYKVVTASCCESIVSVNVLVVDLGALEINAKRTSAPSETAYPMHDGEHVESGGTFQFDLNMGSWPTPVKMGAEVWDLDYINEVLASGSGITISYTFTTNTNDMGACLTRFYFDNNSSGNSTGGWNDPKVDTPDYVAKDQKNHALTFAKSTAVAGSPTVAAACATATDLILKKDSYTYNNGLFPDVDFRAIAQFTVTGSVVSIPASGHDPIRLVQRSDGTIHSDPYNDNVYFCNYVVADVYIMDSIVVYDTATPPNVLFSVFGFSDTGQPVFIRADRLNTPSLGHELGHHFGLPDCTGPSSSMWIMCQGSQPKNELPSHHASAYE
jgi:hypothetical protein